MTQTGKNDTFEAIAHSMVELYKRKNADYGDAFGRSVEKYGLIAALTRISDKFNRIESLILKNENQVKSEGLEDSLIDMACYCIMTLIEMGYNPDSK